MPKLLQSNSLMAKQNNMHVCIYFLFFLFSVSTNAAISRIDEKISETFEEKFKFNDGRVRKQEHILYMSDLGDIINLAQEAGFIIQGKIDLVKVGYEYQYIYIFMKPT